MTNLRQQLHLTANWYAPLISNPFPEHPLR